VGGAGNAQQIGTDTVLCRAPGVLERRTRISVVVLGAAPPMVLRGTGVAIWDAFATARTVGAVVAELASAYGAPVATVQREVVPVLEDLADAHALTEPDASAVEALTDGDG
jgi:hypothetical protein